MRQTKFQLGELLNFGLIKENADGVNQNGFLDLVNIRPWASSLKYVTKLDSIQVDTYTQGFTTNLGEFACTSNAVYKVINEELVKQLDTTEESEPWSIADYGRFILLSNGTNQVYIDADGVFSITKPFETELPKHTKVCAVGGQLVICGLNSSFNDLDDTFVAWSRINKIDFTLSRDNESGFHCPLIGKVYNVLPFEKGFMAYGSKGIAKYYPAGVTFGYEIIYPVGILDPSKCCGNDSVNYWIGTDGQLCSMEKGKGITVHNYDWIFTVIDCKLFYCEQLKEVWFQNLNGNYVFNQYGLYQVSIDVGGIVFDGTKAITLKQSGTQTNAWFTTSKLDFNIGGLKTLSEVYCQDSSTNPKYNTTYVSKNGAYLAGNTKLENDLGVSYPHTTGNIMKFSRLSTNFTQGEISNLHFQTIRVDGRSGLGWTGGNTR